MAIIFLNSYPVKTEKVATQTLSWSNNVAMLICVLFLDHDLCYGAAALSQRLGR